MTSRSSSILLRKALFYSSFWLNILCLSVVVLYPCICSQRFSCFTVLATVNSECSGEWSGVVSFQRKVFSKCMPRHENAWRIECSALSFLRKLCTTLHWIIRVCVCEVAQSCPTLCDPVDCSPPGSSVQLTAQESSFFLTPNLAFIVRKYFKDNRFVWCEVILPCNFKSLISNH